MNKRAIAEQARRDQIQWVKFAMAESGLSATAFARRAGLRDTTLTRFLNGANHNRLSVTSMALLREVIQVMASDGARL